MVFRWLRRDRQESQRLASSGAALGRAGLGGYPGDFRGTVAPTYSPHPDGLADPGEVVWAWVPYEDDHNRGKDRPVLIIGRDGEYLLGLMLTSKDHDRDAAAEAAAGRHWLDVGSGGWDAQGRPSEVRLDRVLRLRPEAVRREGAALSRPVFERVSRAFTALRRD
jgi:hypothetical protein